jgi:hypothetical protein
MLIRKTIGRSLPATVLAVAGMAVFVPPMPAAHAASSFQTLIATAEHNTNTVRTLVHHDQTTITAPAGSVKFTAQGTEDEVRNREQDSESVHVVRRATNGKITKVNYTVDLIFMNGSTYYRTSAAPTQWKTQKGMTFPDPYTGGWKRGRTTVSFPTSLVFKDAGTSGGQTHVHASFTTKATATTAATAGTVDLWITTGSKPYVVQENFDYHTTTGASGSQRTQVKFGPFNSGVNIQPPAQASA